MKIYLYQKMAHTKFFNFILRHRIIFCLMISLITPLEALAGGLQSQSFTLKNGMDVILINNAKMPVVSHTVWYKIGAVDEKPGKSGIAHLLEHMMFKGTQSYGPGQFSKIIAKNGGNDNAFTSYDFTGYYQNIAKEQLELVIKLESDRMKNLMFGPNEFTKERNVVLEERYSRVDNNPSALIAEQMKAALFLNHPYGIPLIGWHHEIENLSLQDAKQFYQTYYSPNNAILVVSGDITLEELKPLAEKYYGTILPQTIPKRTFPNEPPHTAERKVYVKDNKVNTPEWSRYYLAPNYKDNKEVSPFALTLLSQILGDSNTSRLYQELVVNQKIVASIGSYYNELSIGPSTFSLYGIPVNGHTLSDIEQAVDKEIKNIINHGVTEEELARAKNSLIASVIYSQEDLKTLSYIYGRAAAIGAGIDYVENWPERLRKTTSEDVLKAAKYIFKKERSVTGYLLKKTEGDDEK